MCVGTILFKIISDNAHTQFYYNHKRVHGSSRKLICSERTIKLVNSMKTYEIVHLFMTQTLYTYLTKREGKGTVFNASLYDISIKTYDLAEMMMPY